MKTVILCSGGLDSVVMAHLYASLWETVELIAVDYGQRHRRELDSARACAKRLGTRIDMVDLSSLRPLLGGSALTDDGIDMPDGHYAADSMRATIVPNRNAILLSVAYAAAISRGADGVAYAAHGGDHHIYPDCRPEFFYAFADMERHVQGIGPDGPGDDEQRISLLAPFLYRTKAYIVAEGVRLKVPFAETWSCYRGGERHCGTCGTCVERREAFTVAGVKDPTEYAA